MSADLTLRCNVCGEPVAAPMSVRFVDCPSCRAKLAIVRGEKATCAIRAADEEVAAVRHEVQQLAGRVELLKLDWEWAEEKARIGEPSTPGSAPWLGCLTVGLGVVVSTGFGVYMIAENPRHLVNWLAGLLVLFSVPVVAITLARKRMAFDRAQASYSARREQLAWVDPETRQPPAATTVPATSTEDAIRAAPPV